LLGLLRADQIRVSAVKGMRRQIGVGLLRPSLVRYRVVSGFPRGEHLDDEVPLANAECGLFDGHAGRRAMAKPLYADARVSPASTSASIAPALNDRRVRVRIS
jgi:hypothetical protein